MNALLQPVPDVKSVEAVVSSSQDVEKATVIHTNNEDETRNEYMPLFDPGGTNLDAVLPVQLPNIISSSKEAGNPQGIQGKHVTQLNENELSILLPEDISMEFMCVPSGKSWMSSADNDPIASVDEKSIHEVYLDEYWIGKYPVTNRQYIACDDSKIPYHIPRKCKDVYKSNHPVVTIN